MAGHEFCLQQLKYIFFENPQVKKKSANFFLSVRKLYIYICTLVYIYIVTVWMAGW